MSNRKRIKRFGTTRDNTGKMTERSLWEKRLGEKANGDFIHILDVEQVLQMDNFMEVSAGFINFHGIPIPRYKMVSGLFVQTTDLQPLIHSEASLNI
ncbi:hypothetical protein E3N88_05407 [Mikania micrantha]|uniref:Uncharacterized protein n=1 Tax=Mikania micrantha TaxID=192012 RepID=A0A5N6PLP8_9ASTR|nr:hypothetical protein E3N88_05407 [Mikania micrantha]